MCIIDWISDVCSSDLIVRVEVNGLEVARIVHGHTTVGEPIEEPLLEVGVGQADRELTGMLHGSLSPIDQLGRAVEIVRSLRRAGAEPHPLNQLAPRSEEHTSEHPSLMRTSYAAYCLQKKQY